MMRRVVLVAAAAVGLGATVTTPSHAPAAADDVARAAVAPPPPRTVTLRSATHDPVSAVQGLLGRVLGPQYTNAFQLEVIPAAGGTDVWELDFNATTATPIIRANNGVTLAAGLGWYLRYTVNASWGWGVNNTGHQMATVPAPGALPPPAGGPVRTLAASSVRYSSNVCTFGYSYAFYTMRQWQEEVDRLALWGVNAPLAFTGQEAVAAQVFESLGLTEADMEDFFAGPAHLPWQRMGNTQGSWTGPLSKQWRASQMALQKQVVAAMREFGMVPVLPGFAGHVPAAMRRVFPNATYETTSCWCDLNATFACTTLLDPTDPLFATVGSAYNAAMLAAFGDPSGAEAPLFNADTFNEMQPRNGSTEYLAACNAAVFDAMRAADPRSTYVMQAWLFHEGFWTVPRVQAYLGAVPVGSMLILDLNSEAGPVYPSFGGFYNHSWVWNALVSYGGRRGIYGPLPAIAAKPYAARAAFPNMVGVGFTPEAIDQNQPAFEMVLEAAWRESPIPSVGAWLQAYAARRYGAPGSPSLAAAFAILTDAVYAASDPDRAITELTPSLGTSTTRGTNATGTLAALRLYLAAAAGGEVDARATTFSYDLVDLGRQMLVNLAADVQALTTARWDALVAGGWDAPYDPAAAVGALTGRMDALIADLDALLGTDPNFLLGGWTEGARAWGGGDPVDTANIVLSARDQVTLWTWDGSGCGGGLNTYAAKNGWAGLVREYHGGSWGLYGATLTAGARARAQPDWAAFSAALAALQRGWVANTSAVYPTTPSGGDPVAAAAAAVARYAPATPAGAAPPGYTRLADTDVIPAAPPGSAFLRLGVNVAAVGPDCPFTEHGPVAPLAECQAACAAAPDCNLINYGTYGGQPDCVFRNCTNPAHAVLSPLAGYDVYALVGNHTPGVDLVGAWHTDVGALAALCDVDPGCAGFNSAGMLKAVPGPTAPRAGTDLFLKQQAPTAAA